MNTGVIRYEQIKIGRVDAFIDYAKNNLATDVLVSNAQGQGSLRLLGNVPFSNPLTIPDSAAYAEVLTKPLDIKLVAKNFQINFFSKLIPNFNDIRGFLNGELDAAGTVAEPILTGNANIEKGRFFFTWNGLYYRFETSLKAENSDLVVEQFKVYNDVGKTRYMNIWGKINFAGLGINDIDLQTSGEMFFLDGSSIQNRFGFSGTMLAGIGNPPIRIKGPPNNLLVSGQLVIKEAKLYFPSVQSLAYDVNADDFSYRIITDEKTRKYLDSVIVISNEELDNIDPFLRYNYQLTMREPTVADFITYDLEIVTEKNIYVNMIMNPVTREELFGEIQGNLRLDNRTTDKRFEMFGDMNIVGDSYYRFYKNFKIRDSKLTFQGDIMDPKVELTAEYKNVGYNNNVPEITYVVLQISGTRNKPLLTLKLRDESGTEDKGQNVQQEAISLLLFGQRNITANKNLFENAATNVAGNVVSSLLYSSIRDIAPFILNTEVIYAGGNINATDIRITSGFGDAIVKVGGKILSSINNFEFSVEYPLNKLFDINLSNNLLLEISREIPGTLLNYDQGYANRVGITYKIRY
jgi:translocation-and-assembly-module (TAM) inner membrane subunit TamB-like protein